MKEGQLEQHVRLLGWVFIIVHGLYLIGALFALFAMLGAGTLGFMAHRPHAIGMLGLMATGMAMLATLMGLPGIVAGYGLLQRRNWARVLAILIGALNLFNFPIGTILGVYTLYVLLQNEAADYFKPVKAF